MAAAAFVLIGYAHLRWLPHRPAQHAGEPMLAGWAEVVRNRRFMAFAAGYSGYLLCYNQLYLALPAELRRATGDQAALGWLFVLASVMVITGQLPATRWVAGSAGPRHRARVRAHGRLVPRWRSRCWCPAPPPRCRCGPPSTMVVLLTAGEMLAVPVAQDLVPRLAGERRLGVYFGVSSSAGGIAVLIGSTAVGAAAGSRRRCPGRARGWCSPGCRR